MLESALSSEQGQACRSFRGRTCASGLSQAASHIRHPAKPWGARCKASGVAWDTQRQPWAQPLADSVRETSAWVLGKGSPWAGRAKDTECLPDQASPANRRCRNNFLLT